MHGRGPVAVSAFTFSSMAIYCEINPTVFSVLRTLAKMRRNNDSEERIGAFTEQNKNILSSCAIRDRIQPEFIARFLHSASNWKDKGAIPLGVGEEGGRKCLWVLVAHDRESAPRGDVRLRFYFGKSAQGGPNEEIPISPTLSRDIEALLGHALDGRRLVFLCSSPDVVSSALNEFFVQSQLEEAIRETENVEFSEESGDITFIEAHETPDLDRLAVEQGQNWLRKAVNLGVTDIHIEPNERGGRVRFRIDGDLREEDSHIGQRMLRQIVSWLKVQADVDITEQMRPLDGKIKLARRERGSVHEIDVRFSSIPTIFGEKVVLRLLDKQRNEAQFAGRGLRSVFPPDSDGDRLHSVFSGALESGNGIVLVTGPTGCGKSTTLTTSLRDLLKKYGIKKNIITVEDPVEYTVAGATQVQTNDLAGLTFASALRSILRQDPDIVLVGEIRDTETAQIAVQAALTGHLILSTLHTNDAIGCVERLQDLNVSPFLIGSTVRIFQAQRLVKVLCPGANAPAGVTGCARRLSPEETLECVSASRLSRFAPRFEGASIWEGNRDGGCARCQNQGYKGRRAVMEVIPMRGELRTAIQSLGVTRDELTRVAREKCGFRSMIECGVDLVLAGVTDLEQVEELDNGEI